MTFHALQPGSVRDPSVYQVMVSLGALVNGDHIVLFISVVDDVIN